MASSERAATTSERPALTLALRVLSVLSVLSVLGQFVTAGQMFPQGGPESLHRAGAVGLHVATGLVAAAWCALAWSDRENRRLVAAAVLSVVVFGATFVQAAIGGRTTLAWHIPGAMVVTFGVTWLAVLAFRDSRLGRGRRSMRDR